MHMQIAYKAVLFLYLSFFPFTLCFIISFACGEAHHIFDVEMHSVYNQVL